MFTRRLKIRIRTISFCQISQNKDCYSKHDLRVMNGPNKEDQLWSHDQTRQACVVSVLPERVLGSSPRPVVMKRGEVVAHGQHGEL